MKKVIAILVCILLATSVAVAAFATDAVQMTITPDKTSVYRGDTVEFSITMSQVDGCRSAAILLEDCFDEDVFEFVSGKCTVPAGVAMSTFDYIGGKLSGCFTYSGTYPDVSGVIFTFTMKVKETAPLGDTTVSGIANTHDANGSIDTTVNAATVTVACKHNWSAWENKGDEHVHNCPDCGVSESVAHAWDEGKITTPATCKAEGVKTFTCECGATKTELVAKTEDHTYGAWQKVDETNHKRVCSVCEKEETAAHAWDEGKVTVEATCGAEGAKTYTCADCAATKTEVIPATGAHVYGTEWEADAENHWHVCVCGAKADVAVHEFTEEIIDDAHLVPGGNAYYYDCAHCDTMGTETFTTAMQGDLDGDGDVDEDDAIYLLQYVLLPDLFPVTQTVDYDKDGNVDEDDAIYLLQYVLLPDLFPLS